MARRTLAVAAALAVLIGTPISLSAQDEKPKPRAYVGLSYMTADHAAYGAAPNLLGLNLRIAGRWQRIRPVLLIDIGASLTDTEVSGTIGTTGTFTLTCGEQCAHVLAAATIGVEIQPLASLPYVTLGIGGTGEKFIFSGDQGQTLDIDGASGLTYVVGVAHDLNIGRFGLTPFVHYSNTPTFDIDDSRGGASMRRLSAGIGFRLTQ